MNKIDTQHHIVPEFYLKKLAKVGITSSFAIGNLPFPKWTKEEMIALMDLAGIRVAVTSFSEPGVEFIDESFTSSLARECNEFSAELLQWNPKRIGAFAVLPLPYIDASLNEIEYVLDTLKLDGFILMSNYSKGYLGNEIYLPIFEELNRRKAVVFIHPKLPLAYDPKHAILPPAAIDFVFDTSRSVTSLLFSGVISRCPDIKFLLAHAGGTLPYISTRLSFIEWIRKNTPERMVGSGLSAPIDNVMQALSTLYYDTALSAKPTTLRCLLDLVPSDHITFASDYPYATRFLVEEEVKHFNDFFESDEKLKADVEYKTAQSLFPRFGNRTSN